MENETIRILAMGDFHGAIQAKLKARIKKINFDVIISPGDFAGISKDAAKRVLEYEISLYKKYGGDFRNLPKDIRSEAEKKYEQWDKQSLSNSENAIKWLKSIKNPVFFVHGNWDFLKKNRKKITKNKLGLDELKGNLHFIHKKRVQIRNFTILGLGGYRALSIKSYVEQKTKGKKIPLKIMNRTKRKWEKRIKRLFKNQHGNLILLVHDPPYKTSLDYLKPEKMHIGEKLFSEAIRKYQPLLVVCGHMHENQGKCKIGKTTVVNPGAAYEGKAALIELENERIKNIKFLR